MSKEKTETVFDAILESLEKAAEYNKNDVSKPAAILWTDKDRQWISLTEKLRAALPQFLTLGAYEPDVKKGPSIWIRCMISKKLEQADWSDEAVPIIYMPGVSRQELRAVEECPDYLKPVVELQYRGVFWTQKNAKDWTILSFLQSKDGGLGLDIAHDNSTKEAMSQALVKLAETPVLQLQGRRLEAEDFYALIQPDPVRDILLWMNDPKAMEKSWGPAMVDAFRNRCKENYDFDPKKDGELVAGERIGLREDNWETVWERFAEAPQNYPNMSDLLRRAKPDMFSSGSSWPQDNASKEDKLRNELLACSSLNPAEAAKKIIQLESQHSQRRDWVWAKLGQAPLAFAIEHLHELALVTSNPLPNSSLKAIIKAYTETGCKADLAVLEAIACCDEAEPRDAGAVTCAISAIYAPYLKESAEQFQRLLVDSDLSDLTPKERTEAEDGECLLFADGLRFDVGKRLSDCLRARGFEVSIDWGLAAIPAVTATSKASMSPIADGLSESSSAEEFVPILKETGRPLTSGNFKKLLEEQGYQVLSGHETGDPDRKSWTEHGEIDSFGHKHGIKLAYHIFTEVESLVNRISALLKAGFRNVTVMTDHGWLLLPGGLPKADLPHYLANTRWGRCAELKENVKVDFPTHSWRFNNDVQIAFPHGIGVFYGGTEYAHGGLSLQELVVPVLTAKSLKRKFVVQITNVKWAGLRCRIELAGNYQNCSVDIRTKPADSSTSMTGPKLAMADGTVSLLVTDDEKMDQTAAIVVLDQEGDILTKKPVIVGS